MKIRTLTAIAGLLLGATGCTQQEVAFWRAFHAEHPAEAEQALIDAGLEREAAKYQPTPSADPLPYAPAQRVDDYPNRCAVLVPIDLNVHPGIVGPGRVVWFIEHTTVVFGYSHTATGKIYRTEDCLARSPD